MSDEGLASLKEQLFQLMEKVEQQFILLHTMLQARCLQLMNSLALAAETQAADLQAIVSAVCLLGHVWCALNIVVCTQFTAYMPCMYVLYVLYTYMYCVYVMYAFTACVVCVVTAVSFVSRVYDLVFAQ